MTGGICGMFSSMIPEYDFPVNLEVMMGNFVAHTHHACPILIRILTKQFAMCDFVESFHCLL